MKKEIIEFLKNNLEYEIDYDNLLEKPKNVNHGDYSLPCFVLSKELKKNPNQIAIDIKDILDEKRPKFLEKIESIGPFLNFYIDSKQQAENVLNLVYNDEIFNFKNIDKKKIILEYPSPNTNKSLHVGHVRNILIGNSLTKILKSVGHQIIKTNMNNDRGIAICKSMLGYELFFKDKTPESLNLKPDEFISKCYIEFEKQAEKNDNLNKKAQEMLVKWEAGDKDTIELWKKVMEYVFQGYKTSYKDFKIGNFDKEYFESQIYDKGKDIVIKALENNIEGFKKEDDGAIYCDLENLGYGKKYLLRGDNTTLYMTQDLYLAKLKEEEFNPDMSVFIVGKEQEYHFEVLFELLDRLNILGKEKNYHFAFGYVYDKDGKKFSSRKGRVIGADWLLEEVVNTAKENLLTKDISKDLNNEELNKRANIIGYSALAFSILKINAKDDIKYDINRSLDFIGETGPYVQYTYARINSILKKYDKEINQDIDFSLYNSKEMNLVKLINEYPNIVLEASEKFKISKIAVYLIKICKAFNEYYQNHPILNQQDNIKEVRILLIYCIAKIIKHGLSLLDIEVLEEM